MHPWTSFVDLIYALLFELSTLLGGNMALAIAILPLALRLILLPFTLRQARRSLIVQAKMKKLAPELAALRRKYSADPARLWEETVKLYEQHGVNPLRSAGLGGLAIQMPLFFGLFSAVRRGILSGSGRFLWVADLAQPDPVLACICAALAGAAAALTPNMAQQQRSAAAIFPAVLTLLFLWRLSAAVGIYSLSSGLAGVLQSALIRRSISAEKI